MNDTTIPTEQIRLVGEMEAAGATVTFDDVFDTLRRVTVVWDGYELSSQRIGDDPIEHIHEEFTAIQEMRAAGCDVVLDQRVDRRFRVRVRTWAPRGHGRSFDLNQTTTSTSGYPVLAAFEKWKDARGRLTS